MDGRRRRQPRERDSTSLDRGARQGARPQQHRPFETGDDGRFEPHRGRPAVDDQLDAAAQIGEHVLRRGRRDMAGAVGRRRHHRPAEGLREWRARPDGSGTRTAMVSSPAVASSATGQSARLGSTKVSGPGQNAAASRSAAASNRRERPRGGGIGDVRDQGIERGAALGRIEARDRLAVGGVGAEPIDGLGRKGDQAARGERPRRRARRPARRPRSLRSPAARSLRRYLCLRLCLRLRWDAVIRPAFSRSVAQSGSAPRSGRGGRRFKSCHSDQLPFLSICKLLQLFNAPCTHAKYREALASQT